LIRVAILADTLSRARSLADLLAEDERLDIVEARPVSTGTNGSRSSMADVIVIAGLMPHQIPRVGPPVVAVTEMPIEPDEFGHEVRAWLPMDSSGAELAAAIFAVANDLVVLTPEQSKRWLSARRTESDSVLIETLTRRELQVLRMLADGLGNKEIAQQLGISDHTAKFHVAQILAKLGAGSRTEAVALGIRRGLVPI
jgi:DNA-binding CsgD family transcriptional regulator/galactitol-specific phosphotransferase system IIB component